MKPFITVFVMLFPFFFGSVKAQSDSTVIFLDSNYNAIQKSYAVYEEVVAHRGKLYYVTLTDIQKMVKLYAGSFKDKGLSTKEGTFTYYTNNIVTMLGLYHNDKQVGTWKQWDKTGLLIDSVIFDYDGAVYAEYKYSYHANRKPWRYVSENNLDQKISMEFDTSGNTISEGKFTGGDGETFIYYPGGKIKMHSVFKDNRRTFFEFFDEDGKKYNEEGYAKYITTHQK